jgi:hypothetical protein
VPGWKVARGRFAGDAQRDRGDTPRISSISRAAKSETVSTSVACQSASRTLAFQNSRRATTAS